MEQNMTQETVTLSKDEFEYIIRMMSDMMLKDQQILVQNQQLLHAAQHPIATHFNEMKEGVQNAIKWCDEKLVEIDDKIMKYTDEKAEALNNTGKKLSDAAALAVEAVANEYQRAIDRLESMKDRIVEFKNDLFSKLKDMASKPVSLWKDMISHVKEFTHNGMAKLNEAISRTHSENAQAFESKARRLETFGQDFYVVRCAISDMTRRFFGKPTIEHKPYKPSKLLTRQIENFYAYANYEHDEALKYDYKASAHHIKAGMAADDRTFRGMDDKDFGLNDFLDRETQNYESAEPERD